MFHPCAAHPVSYVSVASRLLWLWGSNTARIGNLPPVTLQPRAIDPHVIHHYYRWLSWYTPHYLDQTPPPQGRRLILSFPITSNLAIGDHAGYDLRHATRERLFGSICRSECSLGSFPTTAAVFRVQSVRERTYKRRRASASPRWSCDPVLMGT